MKIYVLLLLLFNSVLLFAQIDAGNVLGLPRANDLAQMNAITNPNPQIGALLYNDDDSKVYVYVNDTSRWVSLDIDAQQLDAGNSSFNATTNTLNITLQNGGSLNIDLSSLENDADWYQEGSTSTATAIGQNIYTNGEVGIGLNNPERALHVAGGNGVIRLSRSSNTSSFIFDRYSGGINSTLKSFLFGLNASAVGTGEFFIADYNENVSGGGFTQMMTFTDGNDPIRLDQYASSGPTTFKDNDAPSLLGVNATGQIVKIDNKAPRIFYPPSIAIDASTTGTKTPIDLYQEYIDQYGATITTRSTGAPASIPTYARNELYYYVTFADPSVFGTSISINADGEMSYSIVNVPSSYNTLINVVFVVK